ncbi:hypothetical protein L596_025083 [Steinernema carpocapsae]|uniref:Uncharacterized protein n=1 Tax=Steinernema carpocapsae TaxID=34508 RepID=A0A4V5ZYR8_STECR|nr:hypothetical protein L596_025083 [Steinernema carpocapsae]
MSRKALQSFDPGGHANINKNEYHYRVAQKTLFPDTALARHVRQIYSLKSVILVESVCQSGRLNFNRMPVFSRDDLVEVRTMIKFGHGPAKIHEPCLIAC